MIRCADGEAPGACRLVDEAGRVCRSLLPCEAGPVANWNKGTFWTADFTDYTAEGEYQVEAEGPGGCVRSHPFGGWYDATGDYGIHYAMALKFE